ncbi:MAG TPA: FHA domain-containing protein, partial [Planctomycetota bacterium]|nr:FHA domain-containing protein [Planctomycetota bacterium]
MAAYLEVVEGRSAGRRYALGALEATIGRDDACEVSLLDEAASRRHAAVSRRGERYFVRDLGSRNGTRLNGAAL